MELDWYGGRRQMMQVVSGTALWHTPHLSLVPIRWALARDPQGEQRDAAYLCTAEPFTPEQILGSVVPRWSVEVTFEEARAHLGVETQRHWSDLAILRTTPVLLGLYSVVTLLGLRWPAEETPGVAESAWYAKAAPPFSDCLTAVRERIRRGRILCGLCGKGLSEQFPEPLLEAVIHALSRAA